MEKPIKITCTKPTDQELDIRESITQMQVNSSVGELFHYLREKYSLSEDQKFDCEWLNRLEERFNRLKSIVKEKIDLLSGEDDW